MPPATTALDMLPVGCNPNHTLAQACAAAAARGEILTTDRLRGEIVSVPACGAPDLLLRSFAALLRSTINRARPR